MKVANFVSMAVRLLAFSLFILAGCSTLFLFGAVTYQGENFWPMMLITFAMNTAPVIGLGVVVCFSGIKKTCA